MLGGALALFAAAAMQGCARDYDVASAGLRLGRTAICAHSRGLTGIPVGLTATVRPLDDHATRDTRTRGSKTGIMLGIAQV